MLNIDLHSHSRVSDGVLAPAELVRRASANGVKMLALTDHDEVAGVTEASHSSGRSRPKRPASLCQRSIPVPPLYVRRTRIGSTFRGTPNSGTNGFFVTVRSPLLQLSGTSSVV